MKFEIELSEEQVELLNDLIDKEIIDLLAYQDDLLKWKDDGNTHCDKDLKILKFKMDTYNYIQYVFVTQPAMENLKNALKPPIETLGTISNKLK